MVQTIISVTAVVLTIGGYVPYLHDVLRKKTYPHSFTWFVAALAGFIAYGLQVFGGGGIGSWPLFVASAMSLIVFLLSLRTGDKDIVRSDVVFLVLSLISLFLWLVVKQPVWSVILINTVEVLGFVPTVRKSWNRPYSETLFTYELSILRQALTVLALQAINILTALTPITWVTVNVVITAILIVRRRQMPTPQPPAT
jgi:hypothetical protein